MKNLIYLTILSILILTSCLTPKDEPKGDTTNTTSSNREDNEYVVSDKVYEETFIQVDDFV